METLQKLKIKLFSYKDGLDDPKKVTIEFKSVRELRNFINTGFVDLFEEPDNYSGRKYKLIRINKIKHTSIEATICRLTLREFNLERLGI